MKFLLFALLLLTCACEDEKPATCKSVCELNQGIKKFEKDRCECGDGTIIISKGLKRE